MVYYPTIEIPMLCFCIMVWLCCCHLVRKHRAESRSRRPNTSPSVYIIPIYEEEEQEDEEDICEVYEPYYREPPVYHSRNVSPPPPYMLEPPSYPDPPPSYMDPPAYSERP